MNTLGFELGYLEKLDFTNIVRNLREGEGKHDLVRR